MRPSNALRESRNAERASALELSGSGASSASKWMKSLAMASRGAEQKAATIVAGTSGIWAGTVVDVGCRTREVGQALRDHTFVRYVGVDICHSGDVVADLDVGLPFPDQSADVVVALDVLEHTDRIHDSFTELCRVAREYIVLSLPNQYDVKLRWLALRGRHTGKWGLPLEPPEDRHRWQFTLSEAQDFCRHHAAVHGWRMLDEYCLYGPARNNSLGRSLIRRWPSLFGPTYVALLTVSDEPCVVEQRQLSRLGTNRAERGNKTP